MVAAAAPAPAVIIERGVLGSGERKAALVRRIPRRACRAAMAAMLEC